MSVNPKSVSMIIQEVNDHLDSCQGDFESNSMKVAMEALNGLFRKDLTDPTDQVDLMALASRVSVLSEIKKSSTAEKVSSLSSDFFVNDLDLSKLSRDLLCKGELTQTQAQKIEKAFSECPDDRKEILRLAKTLIEGGMDKSSLGSIVRVISKIPSKERESFCNVVKSFIKEGMEDAVYILTAVVKIPSEERDEVCRIAKFFIKEGVDGSDIDSVVRVVYGIPSRERESFYNA